MIPPHRLQREHRPGSWLVLEPMRRSDYVYGRLVRIRGGWVAISYDGGGRREFPRRDKAITWLVEFGDGARGSRLAGQNGAIRQGALMP